MEYIDLYCTKAALVKKDNPTTNYHGAAEYQLAGPGDSNYNNYLLLAFEELSGVYRYRNIYGVEFYVTADRNLSTSNGLYFNSLASDFDESTVTWDTTPYSDQHFYNGASVSSGSGDVVANVAAKIKDVDDRVAEIHALTAPAFSMHAGSSVSASGKYLKVYTSAAASGKRPYLHVALSDTPGSVQVTRNSFSSWGRFNCEEPCTFSWDIDFVSTVSRPFADIVQTSATFYWREVGDEEWNELYVSGDERSITVPANTFPARDIQWRVTPTVVEYTVYGASEYNYSTVYPRRYVDLEMTGAAGVHNRRPDTTIPWTGASFQCAAYQDFIIGNGYTNLLLKFGEFPQNMPHQAIDRAGIDYEHWKDFGNCRGVNLYFLENSFDDETVTWNTKPPNGVTRGSYSYDLSEETGFAEWIDYFIAASRNSSGSLVWSDTKALSLVAVECLNTPGFVLQAMFTEGEAGEREGHYFIYRPVVLRAMTLDITVISKPEATTHADGYVNPHRSQTFAWTHVPGGDYWCVGGWNTVSATLYWSSDNGSTWNSVSAEANSSEVVLPAETLPTGTIKWYVTATDDEGTTASSEVYEISTTDSATTATPIVPKETVENGDQPIRFIWEVANDHGTEPTGADLQMSNNGSSWSTLAQISTGATQYDAPAGTFSTGTRYWRVRAYNADGVAGAWSDPVTFVVVAAPPAPVVSADGKPYATITWQSSGQMAYRVTVDGKLYGPYFGTAKSFEVPDFLSDGSHTASVEVQGEAGLWSQPGSVTFSVTNIPGDPVSLTGKFGRDAALRWSTEATVANFYVYRDGIRIGHTAAKQFTDRFVLGAHEYFVINKLPGGYYTRSNLSSGTMRSCTRAVAAFSGGGWLEMALSDESDTTEEFSWSQVVSERYVTGSDLPVVETSPYRSGSGSYRISFKDPQTGAAFEALRGQKIIVKSRGGNVAIGVLSGYTKTMGNFYINYTFSVRSCSWEDYVDETGD